MRNYSSFARQFHALHSEPLEAHVVGGGRWEVEVSDETEKMTPAAVTALFLLLSFWVAALAAGVLALIGLGVIFLAAAFSPAPDVQRSSYAIPSPAEEAATLAGYLPSIGGAD